jgi:hypothetical protein
MQTDVSTLKTALMSEDFPEPFCYLKSGCEFDLDFC